MFLNIKVRLPSLIAAGAPAYLTPQYYAYIAVIAMPVLEEHSNTKLHNIRDSNGQLVDGTALFDGSYQSVQAFSAEPNKPF